MAAGPAVAASVPESNLIAEHLPPHTNFYDQWSEVGTRPLDDVGINVDRHTKRAEVVVNNKCFGTYRFSLLGPSFRQSNFAIVHVPVRRGRLAFIGEVAVDRGMNDVEGRRVEMRLAAKVTAKAISGRVSFPATSCPRIRFVAPLRRQTK